MQPPRCFEIPLAVRVLLSLVAMTFFPSSKLREKRPPGLAVGDELHSGQKLLGFFIRPTVLSIQDPPPPPTPFK